MMTSTKELLDVDPKRHAADRDSIAESWDLLAGALEDGKISDRQYQVVMDAEPPDDADPLIVNLWARQLRRWCRDPKAIGADLDWGKTWLCTCGPEDGWVVETVDPAHGPQWAPCPRCNARQRALWLDHWVLGGDHVCSGCRPKGGKTGTPLLDRSGEQAERANARRAARDEDDAAMFESLQ